MKRGALDALTPDQKRLIIQSMCPLDIFEKMTEGQQTQLIRYIMPEGGQRVEDIDCTCPRLA